MPFQFAELQERALINRNIQQLQSIWHASIYLVAQELIDR